jgi:hypothetical protein
LRAPSLSLFLGWCAIVGEALVCLHRSR